MSKLALIHVFKDRGPVDPGYGKPGVGKPPSGARPDNTLPGGQGGSIENPIVLPPEIWPPEPTSPPSIDNTLPEAPLFPTTLPVFPPAGDWTKPVEPGRLFELKWSPVYGWVLVPTEGREKPEPKSSR